MPHIVDPHCTTLYSSYRLSFVAPIDTPELDVAT